MLRTNTEKVLHNFVSDVFAQAKRNLPKHSGKLENSFDSTIKENKNSITLALTMAEYGFYQDEGVRGVGGVRKTTSRFKKTNNKGKMWKQNGKGSRFNFFRGPKVSDVAAWANSKGLNPYAVRKAITMQGIKPSKFMTKALEKEFKTLPSELIEAYGLDITKFLDFAFKDNIKSIK